MFVHLAALKIRETIADFVRFSSMNIENAFEIISLLDTKIKRILTVDFQDNSKFYVI